MLFSSLDQKQKNTSKKDEKGELVSNLMEALDDCTLASEEDYDLFFGPENSCNENTTLATNSGPSGINSQKSSNNHSTSKYNPTASILNKSNTIHVRLTNNSHIDKQHHTTDHTFQVSKLPVNADIYNRILCLFLKKHFEKEINDFFLKLIEHNFEHRYIIFDNAQVWYDSKINVLYPFFNNIPNYPNASVESKKYNIVEQNYYYHNIKFTSAILDDLKETVDSCMPDKLKTLIESITTFSLVSFINPELFCQGFLIPSEFFAENCEPKYYVLKKYQVADIKETKNIMLSENTNNISKKNYVDICYAIEALDSIDKLKTKVAPLIYSRTIGNRNGSRLQNVLELLKLNLIVENLSDLKEKYNIILDLMKYISFSYDSNTDKITFSDKDYFEAYYSNKFQDMTWPINIKLYNNNNIDIKLSFEENDIDRVLKDIKNQFVLSDYYRCNLHPYPDSIIYDLNSGHWEVNTINNDELSYLELSSELSLVARPPHLDVKNNGVCAIDFGTRSTVVACRDSGTHLLRIGSGEWESPPSLNDYENPTIIYFNNMQQFLKDYHTKQGRPNTKWNDVMVSHQAKDSLLSEQSHASLSIFTDLKQWANSIDKFIRIKDKKGYIKDLPPYMDSLENDLDPIELYAYYLGLYINNMYNGIYLHYILSFPVNYPLTVQKRLQQSFERGIKKSLPEQILQDEAIMRKFKLYAGASEPVAYAITALQEFGLQPIGDEKVAYGVFDFGGGTTDFDFGIEYIPENGRFNFEIKQFGKGGDVYLGGENLLNLLAYEVYKKNIKIMRQHNIRILLPHEAERFSGSELLVVDYKNVAEDAYLNLKKLAELLRPIWEEQEGYEEIENVPKMVNLTEYKQKTNVIVDLRIEVEPLREILKQRIKIGIDNFFTKFTMFFARIKDVVGDYKPPIHIFLAGNASKSSIVKQLFEEEIRSFEEKFAQCNNETKTGVKIFELHMPLGNDEITQIDNLYLNKIKTGKTGVAFGLLRSRRNGRDIKIINDNIDKATNEITFPYILGSETGSGTFKVIIPYDVPYGEWQAFTWADCNEFELFYTSNMSYNNNNLPIEETNCLSCEIPEEWVSEDDDIFICVKKVDSQTIALAVGNPAELNRKEPEKVILFKLK